MQPFDDSEIEAMMAKLNSREAKFLLLEQVYGSDHRAICRHEAAHAVVSLWVGLDFTNVRVLPVARMATPNMQEQGEAAVLETALMHLAGPASDSYVSRVHGWVTNQDGNTGDLNVAASCAMHMIVPSLNVFRGVGGEEVTIKVTPDQLLQHKTWVKAAYHMVDDMVLLLEPWILGVARYLFLQDALTQEQVASLCWNLPERPNFRERHAYLFEAYLKSARESGGVSSTHEGD